MGREHGLEVSDHGMVKCRGQQDDMGTVSKGHLELWHQKNPSNKLVKHPWFHERLPGLVGGILQAQLMRCAVGVACFVLKVGFMGQ